MTGITLSFVINLQSHARAVYACSRADRNDGIRGIVAVGFLMSFEVGVFLAFLATAVVILRRGALPRLLGYAAIAIPIVLLMPSRFIAFIGGAI